MPTKKTTTKKTVTKVTKKATAKKVAPKKKPVAKKPVAKKTLKKTPAKKATKGAAMKKPVKDLVLASDQESFWVQNGEILNSLLALRDAFDAMDTDIYQFHTQGDQNDFSLWVGTVLCDEVCASDLAKAKTPKSAKTAVVKHLKSYSI